MSDLDGIPGPGLEEYAEKVAAGRRVPRPPADLTARLTVLLERRPDLAGIGLTYLAEAVTA